MSVRVAILEGKVKQFVKSESGNIAFMLEDNQGSMNYCFSSGKKPRIGTSDHLVLFGSYRSGNKFSVNFILNKTKNTEEDLVDTKFSWTYYVSLVSAILVSCSFVAYIFLGMSSNPNPSDPSDPSGILSYMMLIISFFTFLPLMIILWILTALFSKSRKKGSTLEREILKLRKEYNEYYHKAPATSTTKIVVENSKTKPGFCPNCGGKLPTEAKFCPSCGSEF